MCLVAEIDVAIGCVFDDVAFVVRCTRSPVASIVANDLTNHWVAISIKSQCLVCTVRRTWQRHVNGGWICLWCLQCTLNSFSVLLCKVSLLIQLSVDCVCKEVTTSHKVCCALDASVANDGDLVCTSWRCSQRHRASAVAVDRHRVVGGQRQQLVVLVDSDVGVCKNLEGESIRASATSLKHHSTGHVGNRHAHDSVLPFGNCTV